MRYLPKLSTLETPSEQVFGFEAPPLHDPCAVAYVIAPELFEARHLRVDVELSSPLCAGQTVSSGDRQKCPAWNG